MNGLGDLKGEPKKLGAGPKTRVCYICGRQYGLHSFDIHLKQCKDLWIAREALKDPKERKELPKDPLELLMNGTGGAVGGGSGGYGDFDQTENQRARSRQEQRSGGPAAGGGELSLDEINRLASDTFNAVSLSTCPNCGRSFLPEKLVIHNKSCTPDNPARRVKSPVNSRVRTMGEDPNYRPTTAGGGAIPGSSPSGGAGAARPTSRAHARSRSPAPPDYEEDTGHSPSMKTRSRDKERDGGSDSQETVRDNLAGHLGGIAGRPLRNGAILGSGGGGGGGGDSVESSHSRGEDDRGNGNGNISGGSSRSRAVKFNESDGNGGAATASDADLQTIFHRLDQLESVALSLVDSIAKLKTVVGDMRQRH